MDSGDEQPLKKRRVTRACDQCRRRRIKCEAYPKAALDAPCVICTEAGQADACTFSRPAKKRGPQAGKAKSMEEKCAVFERLMGYLVTVVPSLQTHVETFVGANPNTSNGASGTSPAPEAATPSSSASASILTSAEQQQQTYAASGIPDLLDTVLPPVMPAREAAKLAKKGHANTVVKEPSTPASLGDAFTSPGLSAPPAGAAGLPAASTSGAVPTSQMPNFSMHPPMPPTFPPPPFSAQQAPISLHTLADAAVPDFDPSLAVAAMDGVMPSLFRGDDPAGKGKMPERAFELDLPSLPGEATRNLLLDLYFNQVVQPCLPMLDKSRFLRWSAHLPPSTSRDPPSNPALLIPPSLYLAVFALATPYLPPSSPAAASTHPAEVYARAARAHLMRDVMEGAAAGATLEACQAAVLCAVSDWGQGELERAWLLSALALSLAINLSLHLSSALPPDPSSLKLKTFHSILIVHTLLSLRLSRPPLTVLEDYDVPIPPIDEAENWELWRSDKSAAELREEWNPSSRTAAESAGGPSASTDPASAAVAGGSGAAEASSAPLAVRSSSLLTFARLAHLCAIGLAVLRWNVCPRRGNGQGLPAGEQERAELAASLAAWEDELEVALRLGENKGGVEKVGERARWTVEMQMLVAAFYLKLRPHPSFASVTVDPVPQALGTLNHVLSRHRSLYTLYRSLPTFDVILHTLSQALFEQADYAPHHHDTVMNAYEELGRVFPTAQRSWYSLASKVDEHKRELGLLRGIHPTTSSHPLVLSAPAPAPIAEPFQAFLSYSQDLGPAANPSTVLDFGSWDQTDLLVSLGLVMDPAQSQAGSSTNAAAPSAFNGFGAPAGAGAAGGWMPLPGWGAPVEPAPPHSSLSYPLPLPIESALGSALPLAPHHAQPPPMPPTVPPPPPAGQATSPALQTPSGASAGAAYFPSPGQQMAISPPSNAGPVAASPQAGGTGGGLFGAGTGAPSPFPPVLGGAATPAPTGGNGAGADGPSTDLLTRWLDRGSLG
ncbi:hypothetical protein Rhopal_007687-T1 [Rhodotorula paludigena]|uniref:Zn(2)-C6 fungal-type domain-containing protein n=1 Tax=Rhodotorula paludigena TaxID=86838 RepID=A0AAV5GXB8_9BASI|nr:hypothetical protein Rhopal_007687-T1 [Rhodotorula paludigena]